MDNRDNESVYFVATNGFLGGLNFSYWVYKSSFVAGSDLSFRRTWAEKFSVKMFAEVVGVKTSSYNFIPAYQV